MAISIKRVKNERGVPLHTLKVGDTFLYDNRVGVVASRNGHDFPMEFATCSNFRKTFGAARQYGEELSGSETVLPVAVEMTYKVVG